MLGPPLAYTRRRASLSKVPNKRPKAPEVIWLEHQHLHSFVCVPNDNLGLCLFPRKPYQKDTSLLLCVPKRICFTIVFFLLGAHFGSCIFNTLVFFKGGCDSSNCMFFELYFF